MHIVHMHMADSTFNNIYLFLIFEYLCSAEEIVYDLRIKTIKTLLINNGQI